MNWLIIFIILSIIGIVIVFPIPLKFTFSFSDEIYIIKFYNKVLKTNDKSLEVKEKKKQKKEKTTTQAKKISTKVLISNLRKNIFKPWIKFYYAMEYSLEDSATTAIFYGLLYNLNTTFYILIKNFFEIKMYSFNITPTFKDTLNLNVNIKSIIYLNIFQILMIFYYTKKSYILNKEVSL